MADSAAPVAEATSASIKDDVKAALDEHFKPLTADLGTLIESIPPASKAEIADIVAAAMADAVKATTAKIAGGPAWMKWAAGAVMLGSVFALVLVGKVDATYYLTLVTTVLGGIGYHTATQSKGA